jgi:hypothetical protein
VPPCYRGPSLSWEKRYGGSLNDNFRKVIVRSTGALVMVGQYGTSANAQQAWWFKTAYNGYPGTSKTFGGTGDEGFNDVKEMSNGQYICVGWTSSYGSYDFYLKKLDASGNTLAGKTFGGAGNDYGHAVSLASDGGFVVAGTTLSVPNYNGQFLLVKFDANLNVQWARTYGGQGLDDAWGVEQAPDGGYVICGHSDSWNSQTCRYLVKTDSNGLVLLSGTWEKLYSGGSSSTFRGMVKVSDGHTMVGSLTLNIGKVYMLLFKVDLAGDQVFTEGFGGSIPGTTYSDPGYGIAKTSAGGYVVTGLYDYNGDQSNLDVLTVVTDAAGDYLDEYHGGTIAQQVSYSCVQVSDGYVFAGYEYTSTTPAQAYLAKVT